MQSTPYVPPYLYHKHFKTAVYPQLLIKDYHQYFTSDWGLTDFQHNKNVRNLCVYKTTFPECVILLFPNYINEFFPERKTTQGCDLKFKWSWQSRKQLEQLHGKMKKSWTGLEPLNVWLLGAGQFWICL